MTDPVGAADDQPNVVYVDQQEELRAVCDRLADVERIAIDTEFVGERTYVPQLELIQVATPGETALIDCQHVGDLDPFFALLRDERIEKVLHAGQQDLELFQSLTGRAPTPILDTQIAAAMAGFGAQVGYAELLERLLGVTVDKTETLTDWSRRPLTRAQLAYAVDDVHHLLPLYEQLRRRLTDLGRWEWVTAECQRFERSTRSIPVEPPEAYLRVKGRGSLRSKGLVVLRELACWREEVARKRNKPRSSVARDEVLVEVARKAPTSVSSLRELRAVRSREVDRNAEEVVSRVTHALAIPKSDWPKPAASNNGAAPFPGVVELLQAVLRLRAEEARVAPSLLATQADLQRLAHRHTSGQTDDLQVTQGWRYDVVGRDLLAVLEGRATVALDPARGRTRLIISERNDS